MGNTRAEIELGRRITEARRVDTERQREAWERRKRDEADAEEARRNEIYNLGKGYEIPPAPEPVKPLPPPSDEEIAEAVKRKKAKA